MAEISASPPRIEYGRFRTRSADADWDFFPFGSWGRGYRVNEAQRAKLRRLGLWIGLVVQLPTAVLVWALVRRHIDTMDVMQVASFVLAFLALNSVALAAQWLYVRRLPSADRPLTLREIHGFLAVKQARDEATLKMILWTAGALASYVPLGLWAAAGTYNWLSIATSACVAPFVTYRAWRAFCIRRLQRRFTPLAPN